MNSISTKTHSLAETEQLAADIGRRLRGGEVIELKSDLGGGKTTFVRGLARGFGSHDRVASPTFTISKQYKAGDKLIAHYDFYRLNEAGLMRHELEEVINDPDVVTVVEWGDIVADVLPSHRLSVEIKSIGDESRELSISWPETLAYLVEGLR